MKLRLQTDYGLRALLFLAFVERRATVDEMAASYRISRDHLIKAVQQLATHGFVKTHPGRGGGVSLARDATEMTVGDVVASLEGRRGVLECVESPEVCPVEPGCRLRRVLMDAETAFYDVLAAQTLADLASQRRPTGGMYNLPIEVRR